MVSTIRICHRIEDTRLDKQPLVSMGGTPKNKLNKIWEEEMEHDNKKLHAQHSVDPAAFLLRAKNLVGSCYEQARGIMSLCSAN